MQKNLNDNDILKFFQGFKYRPLKQKSHRNTLKEELQKMNF